MLKSELLWEEKNERPVPQRPPLGVAPLMQKKAVDLLAGKVKKYMFSLSCKELKKYMLGENQSP